MKEQFANGNSFLHQRDPRGKIIVASVYGMTVALLSSFLALTLSLGLSLAFIVLMTPPVSQLLKRVLIVNFFTLFLWITLPLTVGGESTVTFGSVHLSLGGITMAAAITLKTNAIVLAFIALLCTSTIADLGHALTILRLPKKLCFLLLYAYRYIFVIYHEYSKLLLAAKMRSFFPKTTMHTYKTYGYLFGMTLVHSYNRSQRVYQAMVLRGFTGKLTSLRTFRFTPVDIMFMVMSIVVTMGIIGLQVTGWI